jgi:hypothetical protein
VSIDIVDIILLFIFYPRSVFVFHTSAVIKNWTSVFFRVSISISQFQDEAKLVSRRIFKKKIFFLSALCSLQGIRFFPTAVEPILVFIYADYTISGLETFIFRLISSRYTIQSLL